MSQRYARERGRRFEWRLLSVNPPARTYAHWFYLNDGAGCLRLALYHARNPERSMAICPSWSPASALAAARERLQQARSAPVKLAHLLP